jgi:hypothetical protein
MIRRSGAAAGILVAALTGAAMVAAGPAGAAPTYVGIVIAGHGGGCVKWHAGITGDDVLNAVASVRYRNDGLIVQIDGSPASGTADSTHYWSYWHDTNGSWTYSGAGAGAANPPAGSVEGWAFVNGQAHAAPPPQSPGGLYASLCAGRDPRPTATSHPAPPPRPKPTAHRTTHRAKPAPPPRAAAPRHPTATSTATSTSGPVPSSATRPGATTTHRPAAAAGRPATTTGSAGAAVAVGAAPANSVGPPSSASATPAAAERDASGTPWPALLALALAAALAAAAGWTVLRRRAGNNTAGP